MELVEVLLENKATIMYVVGALVVLVLLYNSVFIVKESTVAVMSRFGKYRKERKAGVNFKIPFIDRVDGIVSTKEMIVEFEAKTAMTKDKVPVKPELNAFYLVSRPHTFSYRLEESGELIEEHLETVLRDTINSMTVAEVVSSREKIKDTILKTLEGSEEEWGMKFTKVGIKDIGIPNEIKEVLEKSAKAELERAELLAKVEAERQAELIKTEGEVERIRMIKEAHTEKNRRDTPNVYIPEVIEHKQASGQSYGNDNSFIDDSDYN